MTTNINKRREFALLTLPALLIYLGIVTFPVLYSIVLGFFKWDGTSQKIFVGLQNYVRIFSDPVFYLGLRNNVLVILVSIGGQIPLGFLLAYILHRKHVRFTNFFQAMIFLPVAISSIIVAILWNQVFAPSGILSTLIGSIKNDPRYILNIFENKTWAILPILFVIFWYYTGIYMVIYLANMKRIPDTIIEAAIIDGANERDILFKIMIPNLTPVIYTTMIFAIAGSLKSFDIIFAMTGGGPAHFTEVIAIYMFLNTFKYSNFGYGSAISVVIIVLSVGLISVLNKVFQYYERKYS